MKTKRILLFALALALPLAGAKAQQAVSNILPPGLAAWWPGDGHCYDVAGPNHGTPVGGVSFEPGKVGRGFSLNGLNQFVRITNSPSLNPTGSFSIEAWVFPTQTANQMILGKWGDFGDYDYQRSYALMLTTANAAQFAISDAPHQVDGAFHVFNTPDNLVPLNVWTHVAGVYDQSTGTRRLYINGVLRAERTDPPITVLNGFAAAGLGAYLRASTMPAAFFQGRLDEVSFYQRALVSNEVAAVYAAGSAGKFPKLSVLQGLKLHFDADNLNGNGSNAGSGSSVTLWRDLSGNGIDASAAGFISPIYRTNVVNGGGGVDFSGSDSDALASVYSSALNFTNATILLVANQATKAAHVSVSSPGISQEFLAYAGDIYHHASGFHYTGLGHPSKPAGYYVHAGLFGNKAAQLVNYLNGLRSTNELVFGLQSPTLNDVADFIPANRQVVLGWRNSNADGGPAVAYENLDGVICEVLVYDRQLSTTELDAMNLYLASKYSLPVAAIPPTLQVRLDFANAVALTWESTAGRNYQLQSTTNLPPTSWTDEGSLFSGTGGVLGTNFPMRFASAKFFRLQVNN